MPAARTRGSSGCSASARAAGSCSKRTLPGSLDRDRVEVLALRPTTTASALCSASRASRGNQWGGADPQAGQTSLIAAWYAAGHWSSPAALPLRRFEQLASFGPTSSNGIFALLTASARPARLAVANSAGAGWQQLPAPPAETATVAFGAAARVDALAVQDTVLSVWTLAVALARLGAPQSIQVPIEFGSSG